MAARPVRDAGRALGMAYGEVDRVAKLVPPPVRGATSLESIYRRKRRTKSSLYSRAGNKDF